MIDQIKARHELGQQRIARDGYDNDAAYLVGDVGYLLALLEAKPASEPPPPAQEVLAQGAQGDFFIASVDESGEWCWWTGGIKKIVRWWDILEVLK